MPNERNTRSFLDMRRPMPDHYSRVLNQVVTSQTRFLPSTLGFLRIHRISPDVM